MKRYTPRHITPSVSLVKLNEADRNSSESVQVMWVIVCVLSVFMRAHPPTSNKLNYSFFLCHLFLRMQRIRAKQQKYRDGHKTSEDSNESHNAGRTAWLKIFFKLLENSTSIVNMVHTAASLWLKIKPPSGLNQFNYEQPVHHLSSSFIFYTQ